MRKPFHKLAVLPFCSLAAVGMGAPLQADELPSISTDFIASGFVTDNVDQSRFTIARKGGLVLQRLEEDDLVISLISDPANGRMTAIEGNEVMIMPYVGVVADFLQPFDAHYLDADGPLAIVREDAGTFLGVACDGYSATGTAQGEAITVTACVTPEGIPLWSEISDVDGVVRTELTNLSLRTPDAALFALPEGAVVTDMTQQ